jgi:aspartyl protease family protein
MLFVGVALLIAAGLALLISADAGAWLGLTQMQFGQLIPLVIIAVIFAAGAFSRRQKFSTIIANFGIWAGLFVAILVGYTYREDLREIAARVAGELVPSTAVIDSTNGVATFRRGLDGHFTVAAEVNGVRTPLLFDTGASAVVLSYRDAARAGIDVADLSFTLPVMTANGTGRAAVVTLDRLEIGGISRGSIRAFVAEDGALQGSLLGMTFLETLSRYSVEGNRLELAD